MASKKVQKANELAKKERQAVKFIKDTKHLKKGDIQLVSLDMAELFKNQKIAESIDVSEEQYEHLVRFGKISK